MSIWIIVVGVITITAVAIVVGIADERSSQSRAWRRIASERHEIWQSRQDLGDILIACPPVGLPIEELSRSSRQ